MYVSYHEKEESKNSKQMSTTIQKAPMHWKRTVEIDDVNPRKRWTSELKFYYYFLLAWEHRNNWLVAKHLYHNSVSTFKHTIKNHHDSCLAKKAPCQVYTEPRTLEASSPKLQKTCFKCWIRRFTYPCQVPKQLSSSQEDSQNLQ